MAEQSTLQAQSRTNLGTRACRRLRTQGQIPGNVYGHKEGAVAISVPNEKLTAAVHSGHKVIDVAIDGNVEKTILYALQWNTFGTEILHFDLLRIDANERVSVTVPIELKGIAPGVTGGGMLEQPLHEVSMEVLALEIPDSLIVRISDMQIGDARHVSDLQLPPSAKVELSPETLVVQVVLPQAMPEPEEGLAGPMEPEVIGRKAESEED